MRLVSGAKLLVASSVIVAVWLAGAGVGSDVVSATGDTTIQTVLSGNQEPILSADNVPQNNIVVSATPFRLRGFVNALSQLRIYVDGVFSQIVPLSVNDTSFTYDLTVSPGTHIVTVIGVSAYTSTNQEMNFTITYSPALTPNQPTTSPQGDTSTGGVVLTKQPQPGIDTTNTPLSPMLDALYSGLVVLDIITPRDLTQTPAMFWRFIGVTVGLILLIVPGVLRQLYRFIWYGLLGRKRALDVHHSLLAMRLLGAVLLVLIIIAG